MKKIFKSYFPYIPIVALIVYSALYAYVTTLYPGGSENYPQMDGYSFFHNLLCDVNLPFALNGELNPARPIAIVAHLILSLAMILFFYTLPEIFDHENRNLRLTRIFGMLTMTVFIFMFTKYHDQVVVLVAILGTIALIPFFIEVRHFPNIPLKRWAYLCYAMSVVVFFVFVTRIGAYYLPFLQKLTFILDAIWVIWVSLIVLRKQESIQLDYIPTTDAG